MALDFCEQRRITKASVLSRAGVWVRTYKSSYACVGRVHASLLCLSAHRVSREALLHKDAEIQKVPSPVPFESLCAHSRP